VAGKAQYKYRPEFPAQLEQYGLDGLTIAEVCKEWKITERTFYNWINMPEKYPDLAASKELFDVYAIAFMDKSLRDVYTGKVKLGPGGTAALIYSCRVRLGHKHKEYLIDLTKEIKTTETPKAEAVKEEIKRLLGIARDDKSRTGTGE
jgi:hypothetical protein